MTMKKVNERGWVWGGVKKIGLVVAESADEGVGNEGKGVSDRDAGGFLLVTPIITKANVNLSDNTLVLAMVRVEIHNHASSIKLVTF